MKKLFWKIFNCNGQKEVHKIVLSDEYLKKDNNWYPYGGRDKNDKSNFSTFENQQENSGAALIEKITNSIDALLLKKCKQKQIDPKSNEAPKTMEEATKKFFNIPGGNIGELTNTERDQMAKENIQVVATGEEEYPDLLIYDNGEGQHPDNFKNTFLSLAMNNKTDIGFVQGKYNMGSTGAVVFCNGEHKYQLVASKMNQKIFNSQENFKKNQFGWTLVRRSEVKEGSKFSCYEYFVINGEKIPQFEIEELDIGLDVEKKFITGSFIKLFSYEMPEKAKKNSIHLGLYREFNQLLHKPALPIWLYEKREKYKTEKTIFSKAVYGNYVRLNHSSDKKKLLEFPPINKQITKNKELGTVEIQVFVLKTEEKKQQWQNKKRDFIGSKRNVIYTLNGQTQASEGRTFISQELGFTFLKDLLLISIECSKIKTKFRQDLFMANRSHLRDGEKTKKFRDKIINLLKEDDNLKKINNKRKNNILKGENDKEEKDLINHLLSKMSLNKFFTSLLEENTNSLRYFSEKNRPTKTGIEQKKSRKIRHFPSIFKIDVKQDKLNGKRIKSIPLNGKGIVRFETDVVEDYFLRYKDKGFLQINVLKGSENNDASGETEQEKSNKVEEIFDIGQTGPSDGTIKLTFKPRDELNVNDEIKLNVKLTSAGGNLDSIFYIKITNPQKLEKKKIKKEKEPLSLPKLIKISKDKTNNEWKQDNGEKSNEEWNEHKIIKIYSEQKEGKNVITAIAINMDSYSLQRCLTKNKVKNEKQIKFNKHKYVAKIYLHGFFLYAILDAINAENKKNKYSILESEELVAEIFKKYSDILLDLEMNKEVLEFLKDKAD